MSIQQFIAIPGTGPLILVFEPIIGGSSLQFSVFFEQESGPNTGIWAPMSFVGKTFLSEMRASVFDANPITPGITATASATPGYIDFLMPASVSAANIGKTLSWGFKLITTATPELSRINVVAEIIIQHGGVK